VKVANREASKTNTPAPLGAVASGIVNPNQAGAKTGHLFEPPMDCVVTGDAYDLMRQMPPHSVDLIITSPPYWGHRTYHQSHNWEILREWSLTRKDASALPTYDWYRKHGGVLGLEPLPEWYISNLVEVLEPAKSCLKPHGSMWINLGDTYFARWSSIRQNGRQGLGGNARERRRTPMGGYRQEKQLLLVPARFAIAMQEHKWILRNDLISVLSNFSTFQFAS
jgi:site-specific DNA-methyltransferase (adenine-specific)